MAGKLPGRKRSNVTIQVEYATPDGWWHAVADAEEMRAPDITSLSERESTGAPPSDAAMVTTIAAILAGTVYLMLIVRRSRQFIVAKGHGASGKDGSIVISALQQLFRKESLDSTWLARAASFLVTLTIQSFADLVVASRTQERIYAFLLAVCLERVLDRLRRGGGG